MIAQYSLRHRLCVSHAVPVLSLSLFLRVVRQSSFNKWKGTASVCDPSLQINREYAYFPLSNVPHYPSKNGSHNQAVLMEVIAQSNFNRAVAVYQITSFR